MRGFTEPQSEVFKPAFMKVILTWRVPPLPPLKRVAPRAWRPRTTRCAQSFAAPAVSCR